MAKISRHNINQKKNIKESKLLIIILQKKKKHKKIDKIKESNQKSNLKVIMITG